jgi:hypothetical protein
MPNRLEEFPVFLRHRSLLQICRDSPTKGLPKETCTKVSNSEYDSQDAAYMSLQGERENGSLVEVNMKFQNRCSQAECSLMKETLHITIGDATKQCTCL